MPNRIIKESICTSDDIDKLSWFEEIVWYRLIVQCDDFGRYDGRPPIIKNTCFPLKDDGLKLKEVIAALDKLAKLKMIRFYTVDGKKYLYIPSWDSHQNRRATVSKYPDPPCECEQDDNACEQMISDDINCNQVQADAPDTRYSILDTRYSNNTMSFADVVMEQWNQLGVTNITKISAGSQRAKMLTARVNEHGEESVLKAIDNIKHSTFLHGKNDKGWTITFDWFIKPTNFVKVLEGNYADKTPAKVETRKGVPYGGAQKPTDVKSAYLRLCEELMGEDPEEVTA